MRGKLILFILLPIINVAQTGSLQGIVSGKERPLPGINILIVRTNLGSITDEHGVYKINDIPVGEHVVRFSAVGYRTLSFKIEIRENDTTKLNVELKRSVIRINPVDIRYERIQHHSDVRTSLTELDPGKALLLPGGVIDVFRTLQALPGIITPSDFSSQLIIRGSGPEENLILLDDVEIFNPYRLYAVISMFNPETVSDIDLITGGFPASYGDRLSSVLDVTSREGSTKKNLSATFNANILSANLILEGENPFNIPGNWLVSSRKTFYDFVLQPYIENSGITENNIIFPDFFDIQTKLVFEPFRGHKFLINGFYSREGINFLNNDKNNNPDSTGIFDDTKNDLISFAWQFKLTKNTFNKATLSWYKNSGDTDFESKFVDPFLNNQKNNSPVTDTTATPWVDYGVDSYYSFRKYSFDNKLSHLWNGSNELELGAGADFILSKVDVDFEYSDKVKDYFDVDAGSNTVFNDVRNKIGYERYRLYVQNKFSIGGKLFLQPGIRYDYYSILDKEYIAPRFLISFALDDFTTIRGVLGEYYQSPGYEKLRVANQIFDFSKHYARKLNAEKATHYVLSFERWLSNNWRAKIESYYKYFDDIIIPKLERGIDYHTEPIAGQDPRVHTSWTQPTVVRSDSLTQIPVNKAKGEAYGIELLLEKRNFDDNRKLSGWIAYTLAWANRFEYGRTVPFRYDQRHTLNIMLNYKFTSWLELGIRFQYGSGFPYTEPVGIKPKVILRDTDGDKNPDTPVLATNGQSDKVIFDVDFGGIENRYKARKPAYHKLDLRLSADATLWNIDWRFYLDVINVYNRTNVIEYDYYITSDLKIEKIINSMLPVFPTLGLRMKF